MLVLGLLSSCLLSALSLSISPEKLDLHVDTGKAGSGWESEQREDAHKIYASVVVEGLYPSDLIKYPHANPNTSLFMCVLLVAAGGIAAIYWDRGLTPVFAILAYLMSLSMMSNSIENIFVQHGFRYPQFVTGFHNLCTCLTVMTVLLYKSATSEKKITVPTVTTWMTGLGPIAFCFALSLGCSNLALLYTNTHFYEMLSASNVLMVAVIGNFMGNALKPGLVPPLLFITVSLPIVALGEIRFSMFGLAFVLTGNFLRGCKAQLQNLLLSSASQTFEPLELVMYMNALTFFVMMTWSLINEGLAPWETVFEWGILSSLLISTTFAVILNTSGMFVMKELGPVGQMIIGELKGVLACAGAVLAFGEILSIQQMVAYPLIIFGACWYNRVDKHLKEEAEKKTEEAAPILTEKAEVQK